MSLLLFNVNIVSKYVGMYGHIKYKCNNFHI